MDFTKEHSGESSGEIPWKCPIWILHGTIYQRVLSIYVVNVRETLLYLVPKSEVLLTNLLRQNSR